MLNKDVFDPYVDPTYEGVCEKCLNGDVYRKVWSFGVYYECNLCENTEFEGLKNE